MGQTVKSRLMEVMFETLYHEGYHASNLVEILKKAKTSKGGMYHHFDSKKSLALYTIETVGGEFIDQYWHRPFQLNADPLIVIAQQLKTLLGTPILGECSVDVRYGCPINTMIGEMSAIDDDFRTLLASILQKWQLSITQALAKAQSDGLLKANFDPSTTAQFIIAAIEGALTLSKASNDTQTYSETIDTLCRFLDTLRVTSP